MALVMGNYRLYTMQPVFDANDALVDITIRVNRDIVDNVTGKVVSTLSTSSDISILSLLTATQKSQAQALIKRVRDALPTLDYGD